MWTTLKRWYHQLGSPRFFYRFSNVVLPWLFPVALLLTVCGLLWGLAFAPEDYQQGNSYRIIFIHVPAAAGALLGYVAMGVAGLVAVVWRMKMAEVMISAIAPFGAVLAAVALFTGAVWGKPTWGTYWQWDARLTSMLVLFFMYLGVIALIKAIPDPRQAGRAAGLLSLVGVINVVIVKYSVEWWNTLHQGQTLRLVGDSSIDPAMKWPLVLSIVGVYALYACSVLWRARADVLWRERRSKWVGELL